MHEAEELLPTIEAELDELDRFRKSPQMHFLDPRERALLNRQSTVMHGLVEILNERITLNKILGN